MRRWRHLLIAIATVPVIGIYAVLCVFLADYLTGVHWLLDSLFYLIAGLAWLYPAGFVINWLARHEAG